MVWILFLIFWGSEVDARPEYALKHNIVNCTACHVNPTGGGIRHSAGKLYGAHGYKLSRFSDKTEWFHLDYRLEAIQAKNSVTRKGIFTMTTIPAVNIPIQTDDDKYPQMNFVSSYGLGRLDTGLGYTFIRYNLRESLKIRSFEHLVVGRFAPPFGLMTDEHRNFTKISTRSSIRDYETGVMISGTPKYFFHYDIAATNGFQGDMPSVDASPWALYLNTRFIPYLGPVMVGASYSKHGAEGVNIKPEAYNLYTLFSIEKIVPKVPVVLISEFQWAHGWNNSTINSGISNFIPTSFSSWQAALNDSRSQTLLLEADWYINRHVIALYRFEEFIPDQRYMGDRFLRHSYGMKWFLNGHSSLLARYERAYSTRPGVTEDGTARAVGKTAFVLFRFWL